ncbi:protein kinase domain-containing protein [Streptomyces zingiberis]|uniref:non-specific serine/threonine protein kinase n=1 Tax=Streptomyces zingiberis TaxID=2053010 RepID=A0ABX1BV93_9ACTN|nr:protein kinase [Streptomyces zingiberis]NJP99291.1 serine/threonine protein kinase [Streptomyces zingiberis]
MSGGDGDRNRFQGRSVAGGRYQLRNQLGAGGMASVYLAHDTVLDRQVAIKVLHSELGREEAFRERFRREAQAVAKLSHTNIVSVFDTGEDPLPADEGGGGMPYIVMEYVDGRPLRAVLDEDVARHGAMPADRALRIAGDVLAALEVSHEMGLVHRDIKPGNVMMNRRDVVKVMDFGIARAVQSGVTSMTQTGMVVGTPQYLSPEQALGRGVDARSDLYSVGILLFELLTGRLPFDADSPLAIAYAHVQEEPPAPSDINRSVPPVVDALVARALKKNPNERFPSAEAMRQECERAARSGQTGAAPAIVPGTGTGASGAGVAAAVFPPLDQQNPAAAPHGAQGLPGSPPPYGPQHGPGGFGPSTPPPPSTYPLARPGYPGHAPYGPPGGAAAYNLNPPGGPGPAPRRSNAPLVVAIVSAVALGVGGLLLTSWILADDEGTRTPSVGTGSSQEAGTGGEDASSGSPDGTPGSEGSRDSGDGGSDDSGGADDGETEKASEEIPEDKSRTIQKEKCTDAYEHYEDKNSVRMPDFQTRHIASVKECMNAAGWKYNELEYEDSSIWGKNSVLEQIPRQGEAFDPKKDKITLTVATGNPE